MKSKPRRCLAFSGMMVLAAACGAMSIECARPGAPIASAPPDARSDVSHFGNLPRRTDLRAVHLPGLPNVVVFADGLYSGGAPDGEAGFDSLSRIGVRTIISVDGTPPDLSRAKARGMRYVHLPIGYNGMNRTRTLEISRAVMDLPGPTYIHCHRGRHRSAGAAGAVGVTLGYLTNNMAIRRMRVSGTSPSYRGLYRAAANATIADEQALLAASNAFPERWTTTGLVRTMVEVGRTFDNLEMIQNARWRVPTDHPDLVPVAEAGRLADLLRNFQDEPGGRRKSKEFMTWMRRASAAVTEMEAELAAPAPSSALLDRKFASVKASCITCHSKYRDE